LGGLHGSFAAAPVVVVGVILAESGVYPEGAFLSEKGADHAGPVGGLEAFA
jgi:hypothetical protein